MARYWLGVVQRAHVLRGVSLGIAQLNHGARAPLLRMQPGDGFAYYSPKTDYPDGAPLREFTAIGTVDEGEPWEAEDHGFHPWRRRIVYAEGVHAAPIAPLLDALELTRGQSNWGLILRRGFVELSEHDFRLVADAMGAPAV